MSTYDFSEYHTAVKVAELLGLDKNTILSRCRNGFYEGAIKTTKEVHPPNGQWFIPKHLIDAPHMIQDVVALTRQINPLELERAINSAITQAVVTAVEPLSEKLEKQAESIKQLQIDQSKMILEGIVQTKAAIEPLMQQMEQNYQSTDEIKGQLSRMKNSNKPSESDDWGWGGGFIWGIILTSVVLGFIYWFKFVKL